MSDSRTQLSPEAFLAEAKRLLGAGGYRFISVPDDSGIPADRAVLAEDRYGVVALVVFSTWTALSDAWADSQAGLVDVLTNHLTKADPKSWDGYLVLLTPELLGPEAKKEATSIRYDTSRIRKLVATGSDISTLKDLESVLLPLMPLETDSVSVIERDVLDELPGLLAQSGIDPRAVKAATKAFRGREPLVEALHAFLRSS